MKATISATEFSHDPAAILDRVRRGDSFLIEQDGEAVAALEPVATRGVGTWRTLMNIHRAFSDEDLPFAADLEQVQRDQPDVPADMWHS